MKNLPPQSSGGQSVRMSQRALAGAVEGGFTLLELMTSMVVLIVLMVMIAKLFDGAAAVAGTGNKRMDADVQARPLLDRMGFDFSKIVLRDDVDYFLKQPASPMPGNDRIAFYCEVPGYYPAEGARSPVSLVAYRVNGAAGSPAFMKMQRMGKGLVWNGVSTTDAPVAFLPVPLASPLPSPLPTPMPSPAPSPAWPQAGSGTAEDPDYELIGPQVFRFEYHYLLKGRRAADGTMVSSTPADSPWDARLSGHDAVSGLRDVAAIVVVLAVIDPTSRRLVDDARLAALAAGMRDYDPSEFPLPGDMEAQWQQAIDGSGLPRPVTQSIRIYRRYFALGGMAH